jgi:hypothetical protein
MIESKPKPDTGRAAVMPKSLNSAKSSDKNFKVRFGTPVTNWVKMND